MGTGLLLHRPEVGPCQRVFGVRSEHLAVSLSGGDPVMAGEGACGTVGQCGGGGRQGAGLGGVRLIDGGCRLLVLRGWRVRSVEAVGHQEAHECQGKAGGFLHGLHHARDCGGRKRLVAGVEGR